MSSRARFQRRIVIVVEIVEPDHGAAFGQQPARDMEADETRSSGDQYWLIRHHILEGTARRLPFLSGPLYPRCRGRRNT